MDDLLIELEIQISRVSEAHRDIALAQSRAEAGLTRILRLEQAIKALQEKER